MAFNVLVVDDSAVMRSIIIRSLRCSGIPLGTVYQAANGVEGLTMLERHSIDIALVDINMPVMSGDELIERTRRNPRTADLPVIVVSTEGSETHISQLNERGARFVHKPFSPEQLRESILSITSLSSTGVGDDQRWADDDSGTGAAADGAAADRAAAGGALRGSHADF